MDPRVPAGGTALLVRPIEPDDEGIAPDGFRRESPTAGLADVVADPAP